MLFSAVLYPSFEARKSAHLRMTAKPLRGDDGG